MFAITRLLTFVLVASVCVRGASLRQGWESYCNTATPSIPPSTVFVCIKSLDGPVTSTVANNGRAAIMANPNNNLGRWDAVARKIPLDHAVQPEPPVPILLLLSFFLLD